MKPYVPRWEPLLEAINRMVARGLAEADAKSVLCNGIADRKIEVQLQLGRSATNSMVSGEPLTGEDVQIPAQLSPGDMDWLNSRPLGQWVARRERKPYLKGYRPVKWLKVDREDVDRCLCCLCGAEEPSPRPAPARVQSDHTSSRRPQERSPSSNRRGPPPIKREQAREAMRRDIQEGKRSVEELRNMREKELEANYLFSRDTLRKARNEVLSEFSEH